MTSRSNIKIRSNFSNLRLFLELLLFCWKFFANYVLTIRNFSCEMGSGPGDYSSEFEYDSEADRKRKKRHDLTSKSPPRPQASEPSSSKRPKFSEPATYAEAVDREMRATYRFHLSGLDAYSRHKKLINDYLLLVPGSTEVLKRDKTKDRTDLDVVREHHRFLWEDNDSSAEGLTWEQNLAKKYYDKLFKEYCIADLRAYKQNKIGMRWRTEKEVVEGKGQFICGSKHCTNKGGLRSWEVNFAYTENETKKNALVNLRLCPECSVKLNHHVRHKDVTRAFEAHASPVVKEEPLSPTHAIAASNQTETEASEQEKAIWSQPALSAEDRTRDTDFDQYFADMLL